MDTIQDIQGFSKIEEAPAVNAEEQSVTRTDESTNIYYKELADNAFNEDVEKPTSFEDIDSLYNVASSLNNQEISEDRLNLIEGLVSLGMLDPTTAIDFMQSPYPSEDYSLELRQAEEGVKQAALEDPSAANFIFDNPDKVDQNKRYQTNQAIYNSLYYKVKEAREGKIGYAIRGLLPIADVRRGSRLNIPGTGSSAVTVFDKFPIEVSMRMRTMPSADFQKWVEGFIADCLSRGESFDYIEDQLERYYDPHNEVPLSIVGDAIDAFGVGKAVKGGVKGFTAVAKATGKSVPLAAVKGAAVGFGVGAYEAVGLLPLGVRATKGTYKAVAKRLKGINKINLKLLNRNLVGAASDVVKHFKNEIALGKALLENADDAATAVYKYGVDPFAKAAVENYVQIGRAPIVATDLLTKEGYYDTLSTFASRVGSGTEMPKYLDEMFKSAWDKAKTKLTPLSSNLAQITDMQPVLDEKGVVGRVIFGPEEGKAFTTKESAVLKLKELKKDVKDADVDSYIVQSAPGAYYIQADVKTGQSIGEVFRDYSKSTGEYKPQLFLGTRGTMPTGIEAFRTLANKDLNFLKSQLDKLTSAYKNLSKSERAQLEMLKELSDKNWWDPQYLLNAGFSEKVVTAYQASRLVEDLDYVVKGLYNSKMLKMEGYKRISFGDDLPAITGRVIQVDDADFTNRYFVKSSDLNQPSLEALSDFLAEDAENLEEVAGIHPFTLTKADYNKTYQQFEIVEGIYKVDKIPANRVYLLVPKAQMKVYDIDKFFGSYIPGFRHYYSNDAFFIKQPVFTELPNGRRVFDDFKTIGGSMSRAEAERYANELNSVRKIMNDFLSVPKSSKEYLTLRADANKALQELKSKYFRFNDVDEAIEFAKSEGLDFMDKRAVVGVVKEGEATIPFENMIKDLDEKSRETFNKYSMRSYSSPNAIARMERGEGVRDIVTDLHLPYIDMNAELKRVAREIEKYSTMHDYTQVFASDWADTFRDVIDTSVDPVVALSRGLINPMGDATKVKQAKYAKIMHDYIRGVPNSLDRSIEEWLGNTLLNIGKDHEWVKEVPLVGNAFKEGSRTYLALSKMTPLNYLRTYTAHTYLGFLNFKQGLSQALACFNTIAISPRAGFKAIPYAFIAPSLLTKADKGTYELAAAMIKNAAETLEVSPTNLQKLIKNLQKMNVYGQALQGGALADLDTTVGKFSRVSMFWFNKGEAFNRCHSAITALMEKGLEFSDISKLSKAELSQLLVRAEDLYMNMGKTGVSVAQMSGVGKTLLQMKGFQLRFIEALVGGNLTGMERFRLGLFNILGTGVKGTIGGSIAYNLYDWMTDKGVSDDTALMVQEGLFNTLARSVSDNPIDFASLLSPDAGNLVGDIFSIATQGPIEFMAGSSVAGKTWRTLATAANTISMWAHAEESVSLWKSLLAMTAAQRTLPSGVNNAVTAFHIMTAGKKLSSSGALVGKDLSNYSAVSALFGIPQLSETDYFEYVKRLSDEKEKVANATKDLEAIYMNCAQDPNSSFNIQFFMNYFAVVAGNYDLDSYQRNTVFNNLRSSAAKKFYDYEQRLGAGILKLYGIDKGHNYLKARRYE